MVRGGVRGGVRDAVVRVKQDCYAAGIPIELQADTSDLAFANSLAAGSALLRTGTAWKAWEWPATYICCLVATYRDEFGSMQVRQPTTGDSFQAGTKESIH